MAPFNAGVVADERIHRIFQEILFRAQRKLHSICFLVVAGIGDQISAGGATGTSRRFPDCHLTQLHS
jgi:hypothetical protein